MVAIHHLHETRIHAPRKARVAFDLWTQHMHRKAVDLVDDLNGMGIGNGHSGEPHSDWVAGRILERQFVEGVNTLLARGEATDVKWQRGRIEACLTHLNRYGAIWLFGQGDQPGGDLSPQWIAQRELLLMHETHKATSTIAAMLDFAAIRIKDAIAKVRLRVAGCIDQQDLIASNAKLAMRNRTRHVRCEFNRLSNAINDNKIVAGAMHFGEVQDHDVIIAKIDLPAHEGAV